MDAKEMQRLSSEKRWGGKTAEERREIMRRVRAAGVRKKKHPMPKNITTVVNKRNHHDVYIGRPGKWGNPFVIGKDGTREEVLAKHKSWLMKQPKLLAAIVPELGGKILGCFCKPLACHGDLLAQIANGGVK